MTTAVAVCIDGPLSRLDDDGDEVPEWQVFMIDEYGDEIGTIWYCDTYQTALDTGRQIAHDRHLELNDESTPE